MVLLDSLLATVLEWLEIRNYPKTREKLDDFLCSAVEEWKPFIKDAIEEGIAWGRKKLNSFKSGIVTTCKENKELIPALTKLAVKSAAREAVREVAKFATKEAGRMLIKQGAKSGVKNTMKIGLKTIVNPVAIGADIAQGCLQYTGYEKVGRKVGLLGNIGSGAVYGLMAGGPLGAAFGIVAGGGTWFAGEFVGAVIGAVVDKVIE